MSEGKEIEVKGNGDGREEGKRIHELSAQRKYPFPLFQDIQNIFDIMTGFEDFFWRPLRRSELRSGEETGRFRTPLSNVKESDAEFEISSELPGLEKGDIEVSISNGVLEIKGEVEEEHEEEEEGRVVRKEYRSSKYYRCFDLPENVDEDRIDAIFDKGVLTLSVPKKEPESIEKKRIEVQ